MESPSETPQSGGSPWKGLLITASILSDWIQPTSAQSDSVSVVPNPPYGAVGSSVTLDIQGSSEQTPSYTWYRGAVGPSNEIAFYQVASGQLTSADSRLNVFSNGSLIIRDLILNDTGDYFVQFLDPTSSKIVTAEGYLAVYEKSTGGSKGSSLSGGAITSTVIAVLAGVALIGALIYFLFFIKTGRASKLHLLEKNHSTPKHGEANTLYENTVCPKGSALPAQGLGSSSASPEIPSESPYQALDITRVDVYDKINPWKKPQAQEREESP
ncbi:cell adhesion molecule CEACAM4-like isoform X2 [Phascolarctos cinereus]|uniref:Carcinoembryonic antigen-related cell adhesion molecule 4-like isoform X2 n=1 Tax=Phascolarctos cinereus TaxID=38626 RepID=A0A6P5LNE4_PHACI|nr:carcinoembryonic antigen-related cell adhesion molecule 4-like isoform X2 [Phascolarctos cinereus]